MKEKVFPLFAAGALFCAAMPLFAEEMPPQPMPQAGQMQNRMRKFRDAETQLKSLLTAEEAKVYSEGRAELRKLTAAQPGQQKERSAMPEETLKKAGGICLAMSKALDAAAQRCWKELPAKRSAGEKIAPQTASLAALERELEMLKNPKRYLRSLNRKPRMGQRDMPRPPMNPQD